MAPFDPEVIVTTPGDRRLARCAWPDAAWEQAEVDDPLFVVIPKNATDGRLAHLGARFGIPVADLQMKRAEPWCEADRVNAELVLQMMQRD